MSILSSGDIADQLCVVKIDHDPTTESTDAPIGSIIITTDGKWYKKNDNGDTTNVSKVAFV